MKTLLVEDDFTSRKLMNALLAKFGEVDIAANGQEAIDAVKISLEEHQPYDLICLDIMMPGKNGLQALKEIRALETENHIPSEKGVKVIMVTALGDKKMVVEAARHGCSAYIIKPVTKSRLHEEMENIGLISSEQAK